MTSEVQLAASRADVETAAAKIISAYLSRNAIPQAGTLSLACAVLDAIDRVSGGQQQIKVRARRTKVRPAQNPFQPLRRGRI